jgi:hypothetical protein
MLRLFWGRTATHRRVHDVTTHHVAGLALRRPAGCRRTCAPRRGARNERRFSDPSAPGSCGLIGPLDPDAPFLYHRTPPPPVGAPPDPSPGPSRSGVVTVAWRMGRGCRFPGPGAGRVGMGQGWSPAARPGASPRASVGGVVFCRPRLRSGDVGGGFRWFFSDASARRRFRTEPSFVACLGASVGVSSPSPLMSSGGRTVRQLSSFAANRGFLRSRAGAEGTVAGG